jgi:hypothetical protein
MPTNKILPFFYERAEIKPMFDFLKYDFDLLPLKKSSKSTLRGRLMIVFMTTIAHVYMKRILEKSTKCNLCLSSLFFVLGRHVTIVHEGKDFHIVAQPTSTVKTIYDAFDVEIPTKMPIKGNNSSAGNKKRP